MNLVSVFLLSAMYVPLAFNPAFGEDLPTGEYPIYQNGILTIPRVDTLEQAGEFQDVKLLLTEQGDWHLVDVKINGDTPLVKPYVDTVETIVTETFPFQVFLKVSGFFTDGCTTMGKTVQRLAGDNRFEIVMYAERYLKLSEACTANIVRFNKVIPLSVYGLNAGTYEYRLSNALVFSTEGLGSQNNTFVGTFTLRRDNKL